MVTLWVSLGVCVTWYIAGLITCLIITYLDYKEFKDKAKLKKGIIESFEFALFGFILVFFIVGGLCGRESNTNGE